MYSFGHRHEVFGRDAFHDAGGRTKGVATTGAKVLAVHPYGFLDLFNRAVIEQNGGDVAQKGEPVPPLFLDLEDIVGFRLDGVADVEADIIQDGEDHVHLAIGVVSDEFAGSLGRGDQPLHAMREDLLEHGRVDHQTLVVADVIIDQDKGQFVGKAIAHSLHDLHLMVEQDVHQLFEEGPVVVEHQEGIADADGEHGAVEKGGEVGEHADAGALGSA